MPSPRAATLPAGVRPVAYDLTLAPDLEAFTFAGREAVEIEVLEPTSVITLNCVEISVRSCRLTLADGSSLAPEATVWDAGAETAAFRFSRPLPAGPARLEINFDGALNDKLRGFYRSRYTDRDGRERHLATTQFEATDARRAFPCWDEPSRKARFRMTLVVPEDLVALSNMPIESERREGDGTRTVRFGETPAMSTYLLAFVVGDLRSIEQTAADGTLVRVWAIPGSERHGRFALETSVRLLAYFNDYFDIPYPLDKLDHVGIPDFAAGAMENWGIITYRETALLVDPSNSSAGTRQVVASIVSHEMAHMWFGDLVTMSWWSDLWLNESFASWMGDKAVDVLFPDWETWTQFVNNDTNRALALDGLRNSHPIEQEVRDPAEIQQLFDEISYSKGASIIRMLEHFLGPEVFRAGLRQYLTDHAYGNAETRDLWRALGAVSGRPVEGMMDTWTRQVGYPVLSAEVRRGDAAVDISLRQERFVYERLLKGPGPDETLWKIPASVTVQGTDAVVSVLMDGRSAALHANLQRPSSWVKLNPGQAGFFRVAYAPAELARLRGAVERRELPAVDRLGLQADAYALSRAGMLPVVEFLALAVAYSGETDASVCSDLAINLGGIDNLLSDPPQACHPAFQAFALHVFRRIGQRVGWDAKPGEGHLDALLRATVLDELGRYGDAAAAAEAGARFARFLEDPASLHPDIRRPALVLAAKQGGRATYDALWRLYREASLQEEKVRFLAALTQFQDPQLLQDTLARSLSAEVRHHDTIGVVTGVGANPKGRELAWRFLQEKWSEFDRRYGEGGFGLMRLVSFTSLFATEAKRREVEAFFEAHPAPAAERSVRQSLERIRLNIAWLARNRDAVAAWLAAR